ncbi:enhancer of mRNA decapping [Blyttiomyces sp. JEL0837]|nr:enhancer of mRNA decapping [Blyttiomyces sp. JEL0837]
MPASIQANGTTRTLVTHHIPGSEILDLQIRSPNVAAASPAVGGQTTVHASIPAPAPVSATIPVVPAGPVRQGSLQSIPPQQQSTRPQQQPPSQPQSHAKQNLSQLPPPPSQLSPASSLPTMTLPSSLLHMVPPQVGSGRSSVSGPSGFKPPAGFPVDPAIVSISSAPPPPVVQQLAQQQQQRQQQQKVPSRQQQSQQQNRGKSQQQQQQQPQPQQSRKQTHQSETNNHRHHSHNHQSHLDNNIRNLTVNDGTGTGSGTDEEEIDFGELTLSNSATTGPNAAGININFGGGSVYQHQYSGRNNSGGGGGGRASGSGHGKERRSSDGMSSDARGVVGVGVGGAGGAGSGGKGRANRGGSASRKASANQSPTRPGQRRTRREPNQWAESDMASITDDFDFQASLALFDKQSVFAEIRESDATDPETLLVSHNRLKRASASHPAADFGTEEDEVETGSRGGGVGHHHHHPHHHGHHGHHHHGSPQVGGATGGGGLGLANKLGIREMVLDAAPSGDETGNDAEVESEMESDAVFENPDEYFDHHDGVTPTSGAPPGSVMGIGGMGMGIRKEVGGDGGKLSFEKRPVFVTATGVSVPSVTPMEMAEIERLAVAETGPNEEQMIENGGRCAAMLVLQALGGGRRIRPGNHNAAPTVVVMAGNNRTGAYGLCAARQLANHEVNVIVCTVGGEAEQSNTVAYQRKIFLPTGGHLVKSVSELPTPSGQAVDLIIDALLGSNQGILDLPVEQDRILVSDLMRWANDNKANILSLDVPSGVNPITGIPTSPTHHISPRWSLAFGLPKTGLACAESGEIFLADISIPRIIFQKMGRLGAGASAGSFPRIRYLPPFGDKFLVGVRLVENS